MYTLKGTMGNGGATGKCFIKRGFMLDTPRYQPCPCPAGPILVGLVSTSGIEKLLNKVPLIVDAVEKAVPHETRGELLLEIPPILLSDVISVFISNSNTQNLSSPVKFVFKHVSPGGIKLWVWERPES